MDAIFKCVCHLPTNHREIGCFFKYVIFLLKRFVSYMEMFQSRGNDAQTELLKNQMWMQISAEYDEYFTGEKNNISCPLKSFYVHVNNIHGNDSY